MSIITKHFSTPFGKLILGSYESKLCLCDWEYRKSRSTIDERIQKTLQSQYATGNSEIIEKTITQLEEYFRRERYEFEIPLLLIGTDFQKKVWKFLQQIPYGETWSYKQLAQAMDNPMGIRAIANANGANAISIIIPCHRIIGSDGKLVGYAGGLQAKKKLLQLEQENSNQLELF